MWKKGFTKSLPNISKYVKSQTRIQVHVNMLLTT